MDAQRIQEIKERLQATTPGAEMEREIMKKQEHCNHVFVLRPGNYQVWDCMYCGKVKRKKGKMKFSLARWKE